jgi:hypothetical protein
MSGSTSRAAGATSEPSSFAIPLAAPCASAASTSSDRSAHGSTTTIASPLARAIASVRIAAAPRGVSIDSRASRISLPATAASMRAASVRVTSGDGQTAPAMMNDVFTIDPRGAAPSS